MNQTQQTKSDGDKQIILSIIKYLLIAVILAATLFLGLRIIWILLPVPIGFVIGYTACLISAGLYKLFRRKAPRTTQEGGDTKGYRTLKIITFLLLLLTVIGFIALVIIVLIAQIRNLITFLENNLDSVSFIDSLNSWIDGVSISLGNILPPEAIVRIKTELEGFEKNLLDMVPKISASMLTGLISFVSNIPDLIFKFIVIIMAGYYFVTDRIVISKFMLKILPSEVFVKKVSDTVSKVARSVFRVLGGYMIIMTVTFIEALIGLSIIRMPYAVIVAIVVMFIDLLPMVGASACFFPIAIYMFVQGNTVYGIIALSMVGIMTFVRSVLEPKVVGTAISLHPLATLVAMLLGVFAFGFVGFLGGPLLVVFTIGLMDEFKFNKAISAWSSKILNKISHPSSAGSSSGSILGNSENAVNNTTLRHIVMWKLKESAYDMDKEMLATNMKTLLMSLPPKISQIKYFEVGNDIKYDSTAYDVVLVSDFASPEDLDIYKKHPEHVKVAKWIHGAIESRSVVDFNL